MKIRPMKKEEIKAAHSLIVKNYGRDFAVDYDAMMELESMFTTEYFKPHFIVALIDNEVIGVSGYCQSFMDYRFYEIFWVNIDPEFQNKGYGTRLIKATIKDIKKFKGRDKVKSIMLQTVGPNFYEKLGFKILYTFNGEANNFMVLNF